MGQSPAYYHSRRVDGKVRREYIGSASDPVARILHRLNELGGAAAKTEESWVQAELILGGHIDTLLSLVTHEADRVVGALRERAGRLKTKIRRTEMGSTLPTRDEYDELVEDVINGTEGALARLRRVLAAHPPLYRALGNLNEYVERQMLAMIAAESPDLNEAVRLALAEKRQELLAAGDSLPERLLIDQVIATLLDVAWAQMGHAQPHRKQATIDRFEKRLTKAQRRHQAAVRSLVEVRQILTGPSEQSVRTRIR